MISRRNRFHGHHSVSRVRGSLVRSANFTYKYASSKHDDYRAAVVVSKKVAPTAVERNRIRRRVYEIIRTSLDLAGQSLDIVIYVKSSAVSRITHQEIKSELIGLAQKSSARTSTKQK